MRTTRTTTPAKRRRSIADNPARHSDRADSWAVATVEVGNDDGFHDFLEESPDTIIIVDQSACISFASKRAEAMFGYSIDELLRKPLSILVPERSRDLHAEHLKRFMNDPTPRMMGTGLQLHALHKDGSEIPVEISLSPHQTPNGLVIVTAIRDVEVARRFQDLLLKELHHRVKNMIAIVAAITSQSLKSAQNLEEGRLAIEGRLLAIEPFDDLEVRRFVVRDSNIDIASGAVLPLIMSLNELCTNAVKYGALSNATGRVHITSAVDEPAHLLKLKWTERGGPLVQELTRRGFGTNLIKRLADQLNGSVRLRYEPEGIEYELDVPLATLQAREAKIVDR
ncbi:PAS domain S-box protein [Afipia sp. Root123D2]|uniref:sensor histidine kinase n=1 Tax=Afipia sp. Root123D2 TaxID=1736436 RepID=UPI0012E7FFF3|nr:PAS domain S-box protein [Afipia sp. Root123D2]